jgi:NADPH:quinone reductase-like Zn-dependent oxidoreductase
VLVTGATGGVGRMAVQLASASGAHVTALVRSAAGAAGVQRRLGAHEVVEAMSGEFDLVIDAVGGTTFGRAIEHVAARGVVVNIATQDDDEIVAFRAGDFDRAKGARVHTFNLFDALAHGADATRELAVLGDLMSSGRLDAQIGYESSWRQAAGGIDALIRRRLDGKAVLHLD